MQEYKVGELVTSAQPSLIAEAVSKVLTDKEYYNNLKKNCLAAREAYNWEEESKKLLALYPSPIV